MTASTLILIRDASGALVRKMLCPADEIAAQLAPGETAEAVDPLVDGFGTPLRSEDDAHV